LKVVRFNPFTPRCGKGVDNCGYFGKNVGISAFSLKGEPSLFTRREGKGGSKLFLSTALPALSTDIRDKK
jgi:hypothetical protein